MSHTEPAANATDVALNRKLTVQFDRAMDAATIDTTSFTVTAPGPTAVSGVVAYDAGSHLASFTPFLDLAADTTFTVTVKKSVADTNGVALDADVVFSFMTGLSLDTTPPTVSAVEPRPNATGAGTTSRVVATFDEPADATTLTTSTVTLAAPGPLPVSGTVTYSAQSVVFTPDAPLAANTTYTATISAGATDLAANALASDFVWSFTTGSAPDATLPAVVQRIPATAATDVGVNAHVAAVFGEPMDPTTLTTQTFTVTAPGAVVVVGTVECSGDVATFTPIDPLPANTVLTARVTTGATDLAGNALAADALWVFTTGSALDLSQPAVLATSPASAAVDVAINGDVTATFSRTLDPTTLTNTTFTISAPGPTPVAGLVTFDAASRTATFAPLADLAGGTLLTATVTTGVRDLAGNSVAADVVWTFTTGLASDTTAPTVVATIPADTASGVAVNQSVVANFSSVMDPATIDTTTFTVSAPGPVAVAGVVTYSGTTAVFTPSADLSATTTYTATITTGAKDLAGNAVVADKVFTFTTASSPDMTAPTVASTVPADLATAVAVNQSVNATFSEPVSSGSLSILSFEVQAPGPTPVDGVVTLDDTQTIATFTPSAPLAANTTFTATLTAAITDLSGNALAADFVWSFTTDSHVLQSPVALGTAASFALGATASVASVGTSEVDGDVGLAPGTTQGLPPDQVNGTIHLNDAVVTAAQVDLLAAYSDAATRVGGTALAADLSGATLTPGLYTNASNVQISSGSVTLDAQGDANAVFVLQVGGTFTAAASTQVVLAGGAKASNVFWQVTGASLLDTSCVFRGDLLGAGAVTVNAGATVEGRLFAGADGTSSALSVDTAVVSLPAP